MSSPVSGCHPWMTAIPAPVLRSDIARVDRALDDFHVCPAPADFSPVLIAPHHLLGWVLEARRRQQRPHPDLEAHSAVRAARLAERTEAYVASTSARVPPAVASDEIIAQSAIPR